MKKQHYLSVIRDTVIIILFVWILIKLLIHQL